MEIFPTCYFGSIAFYQKWVAAKRPVIELHEHFIKQTLRSRCEILGPNTIQTLSIPVKKTKGNKSTIEEIELVSDGWQKIHLKSIETAYASSPFYEYYESELFELINFECVMLSDFNNNIHKRILNWLDFPAELFTTHSYLLNENYTLDYRLNSFDLDAKSFENYTQVFRAKDECVQNLSILDLILNQGPMARNWISTK